MKNMINTLFKKFTESEEAARSAVIASINVRYRLKSAEIFAQAKEMTNGLLDSTLPENSLDMPD